MDDSVADGDDEEEDQEASSSAAAGGSKVGTSTMLSGVHLFWVAFIHCCKTLALLFHSMLFFSLFCLVGFFVWHQIVIVGATRDPGLVCARIVYTTLPSSQTVETIISLLGDFPAPGYSRTQKLRTWSHILRHGMYLIEIWLIFTAVWFHSLVGLLDGPLVVEGKRRKHSVDRLQATEPTTSAAPFIVEKVSLIRPFYSSFLCVYGKCSTLDVLFCCSCFCLIAFWYIVHAVAVKSTCIKYFIPCDHILFICFQVPLYVVLCVAYRSIWLWLVSQVWFDLFSSCAQGNGTPLGDIEASKYQPSLNGVGTRAFRATEHIILCGTGTFSLHWVTLLCKEVALSACNLECLFCAFLYSPSCPSYCIYS